MLKDGMILMLVGMTTVFFFLTILWFSVSLMGKLITYLDKVFPEKSESVPTVKRTSDSDTEVAVAIAAAKIKR